MMDKSKLPPNLGRNALVFDGEEPEDLDWYLSTIDDLIETYKATTSTQVQRRFPLSRVWKSQEYWVTSKRR